MRLDDTLLQQYMTRFCGYGDYGTDYWLVGLEEGSVGTMDEIASRLSAWQGQGKPELADMVRFHLQARIGLCYFGMRPKIQSTWGRLVHILLALRGSSATRDQVRRFQATELGRVGGTNAVIELFPLPAVSVNHWSYADWSSLSYLCDRRSYYEQVGPARVRQLATRMQEHRPKLVLCYGLQRRAWWEQVAGKPFTPGRVSGLELATAGPTLIALIPHPTVHGISNLWLEAVGATIRTALP